MNIKTVYWTAGLFEGEGSAFTSSRNKRKTEGKKTILEAVIGMNDRDVLERMKEIWGGTLYETSPGSGTWRWRVRYSQARQFLMTILPLMGERRTEQIKEALLKER